MTGLDITQEEAERIGKEVGRIFGKLISDEREFDITAYYSTNSPSEASVWYKNAFTARGLVEDFLTNEDTENLVKIVVELSPPK